MGDLSFRKKTFFGSKGKCAEEEKGCLSHVCTFGKILGTPLELTMVRRIGFPAQNRGPPWGWGLYGMLLLCAELLGTQSLDTKTVRFAGFSWVEWGFPGPIFRGPSSLEIPPAKNQLLQKVE